MNMKGLFVLRNFVKKFGANVVEYIVSEQDIALKNDSFQDIKMIALKNNISFYSRAQFDSEIEKSFSGLKFAIGWRWLIKNENNLIVFHDSLLPKYRGFAPLVNSLINRELYGGVTALFANSKYDRGDIIGQKSIDFCYPLKIEEAIRQVEPLYFKLVDEIYSQVLDGKAISSRKQDENQATYSLWLDHDDYFIDWSWPAEKIKQFVDSVGYPYDGAKARLNDEVITFKDVGVIDDVEVEHRQRHIGKVIFIEAGVPVVVCANGLLSLDKVTNGNGVPIQVNFRSRFK